MFGRRLPILGFLGRCVGLASWSVWLFSLLMVACDLARLCCVLGSGICVIGVACCVVQVGWMRGLAVDLWVLVWVNGYCCVVWVLGLVVIV